MEILEKHVGGATIRLNPEELLIINNALNEVCNGVDLKGEFQTRIGVQVDHAVRLLKAMHALYKNVEGDAPL